MTGADIGQAGRKLSGHADGSLNPLVSPEFAPPRQVLIDTLPDQVGNRSSRGRRGLPKSFELAVGQLNLRPSHANMIA
jgi:hypothetical protein